jgi:hypothetical protein
MLPVSFHFFWPVQELKLTGWHSILTSELLLSRIVDIPREFLTDISARLTDKKILSTKVAARNISNISNISFF